MPQLHPIEERYTAWSQNSKRIMKAATRVFPGGDTRASAHYAPYPLVIKRGEGCKIYDEDGHESIDFMNNFTSLIHGHAHPPTVDAIRNQASLGTALAAPSLGQINLAELIVERVPSVEQIRFCSSGTEATLMAIRCARAATGRQKVIKMEGGYHGSYEQAEVSLVPLPKVRGSLEAPVSLPVDPSIPASVLNDTITCPYNQSVIAAQIIAEHAKEVAAIIVEPMLGSMGMVPAEEQFLRTLREEATKHNIVLIFDEVITLRESYGGVQESFNITPDLTAMGKIIGGGLPVGAIGGDKSLMQLFSPEAKNPVFHASTFSGNALTMAAGFAAMDALSRGETTRLNGLGDALRLGCNAAFSDLGIRGQMIGRNSLSNIVLCDKKVIDARDTLDGMIAAGYMSHLLHLLLLMSGVCSASRLMFSISTPMDESTIAMAVISLRDSLAELKPYMEKERPSLLI